MCNTSELLRKYDVLGECWRRAVYRLDHIPHEVSVRMWGQRIDDGQGPFEVTHQLGVLKHNGEWKICHATVRDGGDDVVKWTPIVNVSVFIRVEASRYFKDLATAVDLARDAWATKVDEAIETLR